MLSRSLRMPSVMVRVADVMRQSGYLDGAAAALPKLTKAKLVSILESVYTPVLTEIPIQRASVHVSLWLSAVDEKRVLALSGETGLSAGETVTALLLRDFELWQARNATLSMPTMPDSEHFGSLGQMLRSHGLSERPEQKAMTAALTKLTSDPSQESKVLFCEAGTGTGKTLAYLGHAIDYLTAHPESRVMVAAPSFALMSQIEQELSKFGALAPEAVFLAGQREWISHGALQDWLSQESAENLCAEDRERLYSWLATGGDGQLPRWSVDSLLHEVPQFAQVDDFTVANRFDDQDPGWLAYLAQFEQAGRCRLVVLTHAMLAQLVKRRFMAHIKELRSNEEWQAILEQWRQTPASERETRFHDLMLQAMTEIGSDAGCDRLPDVDFLVVDEAHQLEDAFSSAFGDYISLHSTQLALRALYTTNPEVFRKEGLADFVALEDECRRLGSLDSSDQFQVLQDGELVERVAKSLKNALTVRANAAKSKARSAMASPLARRLLSTQRACEVVAQSMQLGSKGVGAVLHWSPRRSMPRISIGKLYLDREFQYLWMVVARRTALVSGTLYEEIPRPSCESMRRALSVPFNATMSMSPIHARWQIDPVTLHVVPDAITLTGRRRYARPGAKLDDVVRGPLREAWLQDVAVYLREVHATAVGGVLVLGTAFSDLAALHTLLESSNIPIIRQSSGVKLDGLREQFKSLSVKERPMLLATGAAWTGFDLHDPANPDALTDLVILNAPFGVVSHTVSRLRRMANPKSGHFEIAAQALVMVRQAVGRLVRSPDTPSNRRLHWIDGRIHEPAQAGMFSPVKRFLSRYRSLTSAPS